MEPIINDTFLIQKFEGKGGWSYVLFEEDLSAYKSKGAWVKVKGSVDQVEVKQLKLAPYGGGKLMFTLNADLRKRLKKEAGQKVKITLYVDENELITPDVVKEVLQLFPEELIFFESLSESQRAFFINHVLEAKSEETTVLRLNNMLVKLKQKKRFYDI
jgi:hypothetical protein